MCKWRIRKDMLDKQKVKIMTELAFYEQTQGKEDLKINDYYRKDYTGFKVLCSVLWMTLGYICVVGLVSLVSLEWIFEHISKQMLITLGGAVIAVYLLLVVVYALITSYVYDRKHKEVKERIKKFNHNLTVLLKMYEKEKK